MLTSSFMLSAGLKVTNNFDSFLLIAPGALLVGFVWAKHIFPWSVSATKLSQFLYFPVDLGVLAKAFANTPRSTGKYKNWESFVAETDQGKICFAQTKPTKRAPGAIKRNESKLFVTFRPADSINDEVSITSGHL